MKKLLLFIPLVFLFAACSSSEFTIDEDIRHLYYDYPQDWVDIQKRNETIQKFIPYLNGVKFYIDPGHGGLDRRGRSPSGKIVEADANLRVALALRDYLELTGAIVYMIREEDSTVDLVERSVIANKSDADFFISIHHNAPGGEGNYWTNYTSTYYHAREGLYEYEPMERDMARYVQRDLAYVMRNPNGLGSFDGTYSDYIIYPGDGFSVLRRAEMPAILVEAGFFTNTMEETRLNVQEFNEIQAWGIFRGLGKYFMQEKPKIDFLEEKSELSGGDLHLNVQLDSKSPIDPCSIVAYFDSTKIEHRYDEEKSLVKLTIENVEKGEYELRVICANNNGLHAMPFRKKVIIR